MHDHNYDETCDFLRQFFEFTEQNVELRSLVNGGGGGRQLFTRNPQEVVTFCRAQDVPGKGVFMAMATRRVGSHRGRREELCELACVWVDIDIYKLGITREAAIAALNKCPMPPSLIISSGGGVHAYWLLREPLDVSLRDPDEIKEQVDAVLHQLAGVFAGDTVPAQIAAVLRLPGTHNSKTGEMRPVTVLEASWIRYEFADLIEMLGYLGPLLMVPRPRAPAKDTAPPSSNPDPFLDFARKHAFRAPVDVCQRLAAMQYQAAGDGGIHATRLSVSASLARAGIEDSIIFDMLLDATQRAVGAAGARWNWRQEEKIIWDEIRTGRQKYGSPVPSHAPSGPIADKSAGAPILQMRPIEQEAPEKLETASPTSSPPQQRLPGAASKPTIRLRAGSLHDIATEAEHVLCAMGAPIYARSGGLVRPVVERVEAARGLQTQVARLTAMTTTGMVDWLSELAHWVKFDKRSNKWLPTDPPSDVAATILSRDGKWLLPPVSGVVTTPTLRPDGTLLREEGYDPATRLLLLSSPPLPPGVETPTRDHALAALTTLTDLLTGFKFVDEASRAVAVSALITPVVRGAMSVAPLHAMRAPVAGSGKSYLVDLASAIAIGQRCPVIAAGKTEEEQEKRLGAALLAGQAIISIDNLNGELGGDALCQMVERPIVRIRPLGRSELVQIETRACVFATGNNIVIVGDMVRRTLLCSLDAEVERPELRQFIDKPFEIILADRGKYIAACIVIVQAYRCAGFPDPCSPLASYEEWSLLVRSALVWLGMADPADTMETARDEDPETLELRAVISAWQDAGKINQLYSCSELIALADQIEYEVSDDAFQKSVPKGYRHGELREALMAVAADGPGAKVISSRRLGWWLRRRKGRPSDGMKIAAGSDRDRKINRWCIVSATDVPND